MKISGFSILRNGEEFDFPFIESFSSLLNISDELVLNLGDSTDSTNKKIEEWVDHLPDSEKLKIKIINSVWPLNDSEKKKGGKILAEQTNLALSHCTGDWCFYLQADEVLHEEDAERIKNDLKRANDNAKINAVVFHYVHFYGNHQTIQISRSSYRREIRAVRNHKNIQSTGDAQSFRNSDLSKIDALLSKARIFHYGWARPQEVMRQKTVFMDSLYHGESASNAPATGENYLYKRIPGLFEFKGSHPKWMSKRVSLAPTFDFTKARFVFELKDLWKWLSGLIERYTGHRFFEFKNYKIIEKSF